MNVTQDLGAGKMKEILITLKRIQKLFSVLATNDTTLNITHIKEINAYKLYWHDYDNLNCDQISQHSDMFLAVDNLLEYVDGMYI